MMLQLFITIIMLVFAAFETVMLYQGHFVTRSVSQFESSVKQQCALDYVVNHGVARLLSDAAFRSRVAALGSVSYSIPLTEFYSQRSGIFTGSIDCFSLGEHSYKIVVDIQMKMNKAPVTTLVSETVTLNWDKARSLYIMHRVQ